MRVRLVLTPFKFSEDTVNYFKSQTDKLLLLLLIIIFLGVFLHVLHHQGDMATIQWIEKSVDIFSGALAGMITGQIYKSLTTPTPPGKTPGETEEMLMPAAPTMTPPAVVATESESKPQGT